MKDAIEQTAAAVTAHYQNVRSWETSRLVKKIETSSIGIYATIFHQVEDEDLAIIARLAGEQGLQVAHWTVYPEDKTAVTLRVVFRERAA